MLDHAQEASELVQTTSRSDLDHQRLLQLSLVRLLEIIGEAAQRVPEETRTRYPDVPWRQIISLRHRLIHGYDTIDFDILWEILTSDLPPLIAHLKHLLAQEKESHS
jgi:uncharacterized protein with HEPN domain